MSYWTRTKKKSLRVAMSFQEIKQHGIITRFKWIIRNDTWGTEGQRMVNNGLLRALGGWKDLFSSPPARCETAGTNGGEAPWRNLLLKAGPDSQTLSTGEKLSLVLMASTFPPPKSLAPHILSIQFFFLWPYPELWLCHSWNHTPP